MTTNSLQELQKLGQSVWLDNIRRGLITSGELKRLIEIGVTGLTSNPTIFEKAIAGSTDYDNALLKLAQNGADAGQIFESMAMEDIRSAADLLRPVYDQTNGADGFASYEVSPHLAHDTDGTIAEARRLFAALDRPNVMIKVPATPEGIPAVRQLIGEGINVNVTLIFSLDAYEGVREAYITGLEDLAASGGEVSKVASVASFFVSRVDTAVDTLLEERISEGREDLQGLLGKAAVANAKLAYRNYKSAFEGERFAELQQKGARVQRPLWASTSTKNPAYSDVMYVDALIGGNTVNTMPDATLTAFLEHGNPVETLESDLEEAVGVVEALEGAGIGMQEVTSKLLADGVKAFADSFDQLLENVEEKRAQLVAQVREQHQVASLGDFNTDVETALTDLQERQVVSRIWNKDHTVWKSDPKEIADRLGWLTVTDTMTEHLDALKGFAEEVRSEGYQHVVLLGMGGSSLGPEVLRQTFGKVEGFPALIVLDSTVPAWIQSVTDAINPAQTLFLVSSKSGTTIEPNTFYRYFRGLVEQSVGNEQAGKNFVAITDGGTALERLAHEQGFRRVFPNPPDIGGRYSVQSYFGLVPAALAGIDVDKLAERVDSMREVCGPATPSENNPGAWLGAAMGKLASKGLDKLTIVTSPSIDSFGLWVEQLIAESTGKEGRGIVPVAGEPLLGPEHYGDDRMFVYLRLDDDDNAATDAAVERIEASGQPVARLELRDRYDLGTEFFRWEFATAVAGAILGIHPFDQPNVQQSKDITDQILNEYRTSGSEPSPEPTGSLSELLSRARARDYLAIMAYVHRTPEIDDAFAALRRKVMERYQIATTLGYGPRFLHSTGQLHKGGPVSGLFLQITADIGQDISIPGESYSFGVLANAQARGDLGALQSQGRRVASVNIGSEGASAIRQLLNEIR